MHVKLKNNLTGYFFIGPWLICFLVFTLFPVGMSLYYSFTDFDILSAPNLSDSKITDICYLKTGNSGSQ